VKVYEDLGVSGGKKLASRPAGAQLLSDIESGLIDAVAVAKLDRGFRNAADALTTIERWERSGIGLHILNMGIDTKTPAGKLFLGLMASVAEFERGVIRERCATGRADRKRENRKIGQVPFGYTADDTGRLHEQYDEQRALTLIRQLKNDGYSLRKIAEKLTEQGFHTKKGGTKWAHTTIQSILKRAA
jgi:DNA invertase Pin-like site-specific DNA recombinase